MTRALVALLAIGLSACGSPTERERGKFDVKSFRQATMRKVPMGITVREQANPGHDFGTTFSPPKPPTTDAHGSARAGGNQDVQRR